MPNKGSNPRGGDAYSQQISELSTSAAHKGIGNSDFGAMHEILVTVSPSLLCKAYTEELYSAMVMTVALQTGNPNAPMPFTESDLYVYLSILLRERVNDVRKRRTLFSASDSDVLIPHFFYLALYELGDVTDEMRHVWIKTEFDDNTLRLVHREWNSLYDIALVGEREVRTLNPDRLAEWKADYTHYRGEEDERDFVYNMSRSLKMLERWGFVNGTGLPRGFTGELSFMLFAWVEGKLQHPDPNVEPGQAVLASLLAFSRSATILNPYIPYGPENAYRLLLKEVTLPRGTKAS